MQVETGKRYVAVNAAGVERRGRITAKQIKDAGLCEFQFDDGCLIYCTACGDAGTYGRLFEEASYVKQHTEERVMTKWSSPAVDAYVEALRREHHLPPWRNPDGSLAVTPAEAKAHEAVVADEEAVRRRFREVEQRDGFEAAIKDLHGEHVTVVDARHEIEAQRTETKQPRVHFAYEADEPERLRRVFASWDFRNGT